MDHLDRQELGALRDLVRVKERQIEELEKKVVSLEMVVMELRNIQLAAEALLERIPPPPETI